MNPKWSDEVKERYTKDQEFYAQCSARGIQIRLNTDTLELEGHMIRKPIGITAPYRKDDDDDIQDYKKPWVGLTKEEFEKLVTDAGFTRSDLLMIGSCVEQIVELVEAELKRKNT